MLRGRLAVNDECSPVLAATVIVNGQEPSGSGAVIRQVPRTCYPFMRHLCFETRRWLSFCQPRPSSPKPALDRLPSFVCSRPVHVCGGLSTVATQADRSAHKRVQRQLRRPRS
jgi:hypothetical protein